MNILITRLKKEAILLANDIKKNNLTPFIFPTLSINKLEITPINQNTDIVIFISANAVEYGYHLLKNFKKQVVAIGQKTADKLKEKNITVAFYPKQNPSSESLLNLPEMQKLTNKNIVIIRGVGGQETLKNTLSKNNTVTYKEVYERVLAKPSNDELQIKEDFLSKDKGVIIITSVDNLLALLTLIPNKIIFNYPVIALSSRIKTVALQHGFKKCLVTNDISNHEIINSILTIMKH